MSTNRCDLCQEPFPTIRGMKIHRAACIKKHPPIINPSHQPDPPPDIADPPPNIAETTDNQTSTLPDIPRFTPVNHIPSKAIYNLEGSTFAQQINSAYESVLKWRGNLMMLPSGKAAKDFVLELSCWLEHFNNDTEFAPIALKVYHILPSLLLQKPSKNSKSRDHLKKLEERLAQWKNGNILNLLEEGKIIQQKLTTGKRRSPEENAKTFAKLMLQGKINAALNLLSTETSGGVLPLSESVIAGLNQKHPAPAPVQDDALLFRPINKIPANFFDSIDEQSITKAAQLTKGGAGPSHLDAKQYRHILLSNKYKSENKRLREQIAKLARKLATTILDPTTLEALVCCRLVPLDKCPGIRPIGIGEVLRRIIGKTIGWSLKTDLMESVGPLQAAGGAKGGAEAAIHAMRTIFEDDNTDAVILVDASNAFNSLNRQVALHNVQRTCPAFATILINTYRNSSRLAVSGGAEIKSQEGSTQGDNLGGHFYNQGTIPLQTLLSVSAPDVSQVWLADDATGAGTLQNLKEWWNCIIKHGVRFGYLVNNEKSWLILKNIELQQQAIALFQDTNINITCEGKRHLGAAIGSKEFHKAYAEKKISKWCGEIEQLALFAKTQPQAAYAAFTHGEMHRFTYFLRTIPDMCEYLKPLDDAIDNLLLPAILGTDIISEVDRNLYALPVRMGGLGFPHFAEKAENDFCTSKQITGPLAAIMVTQGTTLPAPDEVAAVRAEVNKRNLRLQQNQEEFVISTLDEQTKKAVEQAKEKGASNWISTLPLEDQGFTLNKGEFRDAIAIRYNKPLRNLPSKCPCGQQFNLNHALNCKRGGLVIIRHNNIRDFEANLIRQVCNDVETEPPLQPLDGEIINGLTGDEARPDLRARGFWRHGQNAYFDVRVTNTNSASQSNLTTAKVYAKHEKEKKKNYNQRIMQVEHGTFTPLIYSVNGGIGPECEQFHKHLAEKIAEKSGEQYTSILTWIRCKLSFLLLRAALMCVRASRPHTTKNETTTTTDFALACRDARIN